eukprot:6202824-Pleurochrysis_carterae.AAC.3
MFKHSKQFASPPQFPHERVFNVSRSSKSLQELGYLLLDPMVSMGTKVCTDATEYRGGNT